MDKTSVTPTKRFFGNKGKRESKRPWLLVGSQTRLNRRVEAGSEV